MKRIKWSSNVLSILHRYRCLRERCCASDIEARYQYKYTNTKHKYKHTNTQIHETDTKFDRRKTRSRCRKRQRIFWQCWGWVWSERLMSYKTCGTRCVWCKRYALLKSLLCVYNCLPAIFMCVGDNLVSVDSLAWYRYRCRYEHKDRCRYRYVYSFLWGFVTLSRTWLAYFRHGFHFGGKRVS